MRVVPMPIKRELEHPRPGQTEPVAQRSYIRADKTQILGDEWQTTQFSLHHLEELGAGARHPLAGLRRRCARRHVPRGGETAEMVQAHSVDVMQKRTQTIDTPAVPGATNSLPIIDRIAPELPGGAEIIGRDTRDKTWPILRVEQEQLGVGPDIARVGGHEKGQVADEVQTSSAGVLLQALHLSEQEELGKPNLIDLVHQRLARTLQRCGNSSD